MTHYNLMDPIELAELGWFSNDPLTHVLGASLQDHIEELELLHDNNRALTKRITDLEKHVVPDLETQIERLRAMIDNLEDQNARLRENVFAPVEG